MGAPNPDESVARGGEEEGAVVSHFARCGAGAAVLVSCLSQPFLLC